MVSQQMVAGLRDQNHQSKVLAEATSLKTLQLQEERLQSLEATEESATKFQVLSASSSAASGKSSYKKAVSGVASKKAPESKAQDKKNDVQHVASPHILVAVCPLKWFTGKYFDTGFQVNGRGGVVPPPKLLGV